MDPLAHASIGLMAKPIASKAPLLVLLAATQIPDLLFFGFEAAGMEHQAVTQVDLNQGLTYLSQPSLAWSHGVSMCILWSVLAAAITYPFFRDRRTSLVIGLMVFSHWLLDFIVSPNLPLFLGGSPVVGLGLITSGPGLVAGVILEVVLIAGGIAIYWISRKR